MSENKKMSSYVTSLYVYALKSFVQRMDLTVKNLNNMCHLRSLPASVLSDIYCEVIIDPISNFSRSFEAQKVND